MKTKLLFKSLLITGLLAVACGYPMQASAITFDFHQESGFEVTTMIGTVSGNTDLGWFQLPNSPLPHDATLGPPAVNGNYFNTIAWGQPTEATNGDGSLGYDPFLPPYSNGSPSQMLSGLRVLGKDGSVTTGGDWVPLSTVYHQSNFIQHENNSAAHLLTANIYSELSFYQGVDPNPIPTPPNPIWITFNETPGGNTADNWTFQLSGFVPVNFSYGDHQYEAEFGMGNFNGATSDFPNCPGGTCTVTTVEGVTSSLDVMIRISEVSVPEPTSLVLLGLGLLGLGFAKRRVMMKG